MENKRSKGLDPEKLMEYIIVCHAGVGIGVGHLTRSLVIANALKARGASAIKFLVQGDFINRADLLSFDPFFIDKHKNIGKDIENLINPLVHQVFIFDLHPDSIPDQFYDTLLHIRKAGNISIAVDGLTQFSDALNLIYMPTFKDHTLIASKLPSEIKWGWDCFLLNTKYPSFERTSGKKILVLTGGGDATGLGKTFPALLNEQLDDEEIEIHWVVGPFSAMPVIPETHNVKWVLYQAPEGLDDLMVKVNYAITLYGVSFFELLRYGIPTVVFSPYGGKDNEELNTVSNEQVALVAADEMEAVKKIKDLMMDPQLATSIAKRAKEKLLLSGGTKFADEVNKITKEKWQVHT